MTSGYEKSSSRFTFSFGRLRLDQYFVAVRLHPGAGHGSTMSCLLLMTVLLPIDRSKRHIHTPSCPLYVRVRVRARVRPKA